MDLKSIIAENKKLAQETLKELKPQLDEIRAHANAVQADILGPDGLDAEEPKPDGEAQPA
jgi:hypothetical protein